MRLIDADALKELFSEVIGHIAKKPEMNGNLEHMIRASAMVIQMIDDAPTVQPERKTGRWITDDSELEIKCNKCGKSFSDYVNAGTGYVFLEEIPNFCPNCGRNMEEGEQDDKTRTVR